MMMAAFLRRRVALTLFLFLLRDGQAAKRAHSKRERERDGKRGPPYLLRPMTGKGRKKNIIVVIWKKKNHLLKGYFFHCLRPLLLLRLSPSSFSR